MTYSTSSTPTAVETTALRIAHARAVETDRPDSLFDDPYAARFVDAAGVGDDFYDTIDRFQATLGAQVAIRTRYLDDQLIEAVAAGCRQVVLLGAGMDARAFRLRWPEGTRIFEIDLPDLLRFKESVLIDADAQPECRRITIGTDLAGSWSSGLTMAGFDPAQPTAWLVEGLIYALTSDEVEALLKRIATLSAAGSRLAIEHREDSEAQRAARAAVDPELAGVWKGGPREPLDELLERHGWRAEVLDLATVGRTYDRPVPPAFDPAKPDAGRSWLASAQRH